MIITNFKKLARNPLRKKALLIAGAAYEAIEVKKAVSRKIELKGNMLNIATIDDGKNICLKLDLNSYKRIFLVGIGKGTALASTTLAKILGKRLTGGIALDVQKPKLEIGNCLPAEASAQAGKLEIFQGTHPLPSPKNIAATQKIIKLAKGLKKEDLLITFICGGGSALLCASEKERKNLILVTKLLTQAGANILELNTVRKRLSLVKGGGLAKMAYPATLVSLIISDVLGNDLSVVASGPTVFDKTTKKDAIRILKKYNFQFSIFNFQLKETPKDKKYFKKVKNILFLSNQKPVLAMVKKAKQLGFRPKIHSLKIQGEAKNALLPLMEAIRAGEAVLAAGETTVTLKNPKSEILNPKQTQNSKLKTQNFCRGGRNMEAVLGAISNFSAFGGSAPGGQFPISKNLLVLSIASDGRDNTEAAGAVGDFSTLEKAKKLKLVPRKFLDQNNSFNFFKKTGDLIFAEQKSFNVSDLMLVLSSSKD